jgi:hypothetical protein
MMNKNNNSIMVWNCRGAASTAFYRYCKQYVATWKPLILVIMETRCNPVKLKRTFNLLGYDGFLSTDNSGYAGGIVVAWKLDLFMVNLEEKKFQYIHMKVNYINRREWYFTAVYASPQEDSRSILWTDLKRIADHMNESWILAGDFNDIMSLSEKKGGAPVSLRKCTKFKERVDACHLLDIGYVGPKFTWRGPIYHGGQRIFERLDRALGNELWRLEFPDGYVKVLPRLEFSDHHPLLVCPVDGSHLTAPKQFRFESAWLMESNYNNLLKGVSPGQFPVWRNLQNVRDSIDQWKLDSFDQTRNNKKNWWP